MIFVINIVMTVGILSFCLRVFGFIPSVENTSRTTLFAFWLLAFPATHILSTLIATKIIGFERAEANPVSLILALAYFAFHGPVQPYGLASILIFSMIAFWCIRTVLLKESQL